MFSKGYYLGFVGLVFKINGFEFRAAREIALLSKKDMQCRNDG